MSGHRIDQDLAATAARLLPDTIDRDLRTRYRQLPVMLRTAGLAATYAFLAAKANGNEPGLAQAYGRAADGIRDRLTQLGLLPDETGSQPQLGPREVLAALGEMSLSDYARAGAEAAALTGWLSRLADALYRADGNSQADGNSRADDNRHGLDDRGGGS